jgi:NAD(P)-dependent dehydrogenase (short-subunit alcohol dehydrogenase family)
MGNSLHVKVALVTGGSRGLGAAVALALADEGADVAISYEKSTERAEAVIAEVNNAAVAWQGRRIDDPEIDDSAMDRQWAINVSGVVANIRAASKILSEGGRIISVGSGVGTRAGFPGTADYAGTKAALIGYSKGVATDLGPRKITVNVVQAGIMATDMLAGSEDKLPAGILDLHALGRIATVAEVAAGIVFLASPVVRYVTGSVLDVNGGYLA